MSTNKNQQQQRTLAAAAAAVPTCRNDVISNPASKNSNANEPCGREQERALEHDGRIRALENGLAGDRIDQIASEILKEVRHEENTNTKANRDGCLRRCKDDFLRIENVVLSLHCVRMNLALKIKRSHNQGTAKQVIRKPTANLVDALHALVEVEVDAPLHRGVIECAGDRRHAPERTEMNTGLEVAARRVEVLIGLRTTKAINMNESHRWD